MSKIMSMFEKLNLVEKIDTEIENTSEINNIIIEEQNAPEENQESEKKHNTESFDDTKDKKNAYIRKELNYENKMTTEEIYSSYGIENSSINTVFMLGNFINAMPENLPYEVKKQSVMNIINASNINLNSLISDGEQRLNALNTFTKESYSANTNIINEYKKEIIKLNDLINSYNQQIRIKDNVFEEQNNLIKYETEKINNIIKFF